MEYVVKLTEAEDLALSSVAMSQQDWIDNVVHNRCRIAIDEIVSVTVQKALDIGMQLPTSKEDVVKLGFEKEWVVAFSKKSLDLTV
jgi:hypothetical protein